jgi:hypothetical protein
MNMLWAVNTEHNHLFDIGGAAWTSDKHHAVSRDRLGTQSAYHGGHIG